MAVLTFLVPSITARTLLMLPIILGIGQAFQAAPGKSNIMKALMFIIIAHAVAIGADPMAFALILGMNMPHQYLLPVTNMPNAVAMGSGHITSQEMMKTGAVMSILAAAFMTVVALTYWTWLGLTG